MFSPIHQANLLGLPVHSHSYNDFILVHFRWFQLSHQTAVLTEDKACPLLDFSAEGFLTLRFGTKDEKQVAVGVYFLYPADVEAGCRS